MMSYDDKLILISNCVKIITNLLRISRNQSKKILTKFSIRTQFKFNEKIFHSAVPLESLLRKRVLLESPKVANPPAQTVLEVSVVRWAIWSCVSNTICTICIRRLRVFVCSTRGRFMARPRHTRRWPPQPDLLCTLTRFERV